MDLKHDVTTLAGKLLRPLRAGTEKLAEVKDAGANTVEVTTTSFAPGGTIPQRYAGERAPAPALAWSGIPQEAKEVVVLCEDPDAPFPKPFVHWALYGIPPTTSAIPEGKAAPGVEGKNSTGKLGFTGPKPPPGHGTHHYHFQVFAVDAPLGLPAGADRDAIVSAMKDHVLASGEVMGTFEAR